MNLIGYLHFRSVDAIRYPIYDIDGDYFYLYRGKKYKLNIPNNFVNKFIDIVLSDRNYVDYEKEKKEKGFPLIYKINNIQVITPFSLKKWDTKWTP